MIRFRSASVFTAKSCSCPTGATAGIGASRPSAPRPPNTTASIRKIEKAIDAGKLGQAKLIIANLPEGRRTADALAERLKARVVASENFPALRHGGVSYDSMLQSNLGALLLSALFGAASGLGGFLIAAATDLPSGAVIVLVSSALVGVGALLGRFSQT